MSRTRETADHVEKIGGVHGIPAGERALHTGDSIDAPPIRQTALFGPTDADGRADFIEETNAGLEVNTEGLDSEALRITVALGFSPAPVNRTVKIDSNLEWTGLADNTVNYLGLRVESDGTIETVHTTSLDYGYTHPSSPSTDDYSFLIPAMRMYRWDGADWVTDPVVFVGQAETDTGAVVEARSYAYQGRTRITGVSVSTNSTVSQNHNIGTIADGVVRVKVNHGGIDGWRTLSFQENVHGGGTSLRGNHLAVGENSMTLFTSPDRIYQSSGTSEDLKLNSTSNAAFEAWRSF